MESESEYVAGLSTEAKKRYGCKIASCGLKTDPYTILSWIEEPSVIPNVQWSDMAVYLVSTPSPYTREEIKAWKGMLDGGNFMKSGWVHNLKLHQFSGSGGLNFVIMGKVKHSQRMSADSLLPWVIVASHGQILAAHCTCMAGLGEACSHIAAILSCLIQATAVKQESGEDACTSKQCSWLPATRNVVPAKIKDIKFSKTVSTDDKQVPPPKRVKVAPPSEGELNIFFDALNKAENKPAILSIVDPYHQQFIPKLSKPEFPKPVLEAYNPAALALNYLELLRECEKVYESITISRDQAKRVEEETRKQSHDKKWFLHRAGRITASNFKSVFHTNLCMPSQSLILNICHPELNRFSTEATRWGIEHETEAIQQYIDTAKQTHDEIQIFKTGFLIDPENPFIGASPDSIVECKCCGKGAVEVKCPFKFKDKLPDSEDSTFCMTQQDRKWVLRRDHMYYYQVQMQLHVGKFSYADFVVWSQHGIRTERILIEPTFLASKMNTLKHFFIYALLPEVVGKWYSRKPVADLQGIVDLSEPQQSTLDDNRDQDDPNKPWCFCNQPESGEMIKCDNKSCTIQWFHFDCLRLIHAPKGKWYCPSCAKLSKFNKNKK